MRPFQIIKKAEEMDISVMAALAMRKRYLLGMFDEWADYIDGKTNDIPLVTPSDAIDEIIAIRKAEVNRNKPMKGGITDDMIATAKEYPVDQLVEFTRGKAIAWCHDDSNPSLSWHRGKNRCTCFPCGKSFNAIDICMERDGMTFIEAVKLLGR